MPRCVLPFSVTVGAAISVWLLLLEPLSTNGSPLPDVELAQDVKDELEHQHIPFPDRLDLFLPRTEFVSAYVESTSYCVPHIAGRCLGCWRYSVAGPSALTLTAVQTDTQTCDVEHIQGGSRRSGACDSKFCTEYPSRDGVGHVRELHPYQSQELRP